MLDGAFPLQISVPASPVFGLLISGYNLAFSLLALSMTLVSHLVLAFSLADPRYPVAVMGLAYSIMAPSVWPLPTLVVEEHQIGTAFGKGYIKMNVSFPHVVHCSV